MTRKLFAVVALFAVIGLGIFLYPTLKSGAQIGGWATIPGGVTPVNQFQNSSATGLAGAVTNPASNFIVQVAGGPVYYGGNIQTIAQAQLTLSASQTYMIVWNGLREQLYAKQAVTGPGSNGTNAINGPGAPTSLLFADPNQGEIALATVACNATACGNGGNGTITDNRSLANFPAGTYVAGHVNTAKSNSDVSGTCTLAANTCTVTFANAFQSAPVCVVTDQTTPQLVKAAPTASNVVITDTVGATDVVAYACFGNPN